MQMRSESHAKVQVPSAKNSEWNAAKNPSKSTTTQAASTANTAITAIAARLSTAPNSFLPQRTYTWAAAAMQAAATAASAQRMPTSTL